MRLFVPLLGYTPTMAIDAGAPLPAVKEMLDHSSLKHTNIDVHTVERVKRGGEQFITQY